jgi:hypothetical protein
MYSKSPSTFVEKRTDQSLSLLASENGQNLQLQDVIDNLVYSNTNNIQVPTDRRVTIGIENLDTHENIDQEIVINAHVGDQKLLIEGTCPRVANKQNSIFRLCNDVRVSSKSCYNTIDTLSVLSAEPLDNSVRVYIPSAYLNRYKLNSWTSEYGFVVYGVATVEEYSHLIKQIKYSNNGLMNKNVKHVFKVQLISSRVSYSYVVHNIHVFVW